MKHITTYVAMGKSVTYVAIYQCVIKETGLKVGRFVGFLHPPKKVLANGKK